MSIPTKQTGIKIEVPLLVALKKAAKKDGRTLSWLVNDILKKHLKMKTTKSLMIAVAFALLSLTSQSQSIRITGVVNSRVCPGDTLTVRYAFAPQPHPLVIGLHGTSISQVMQMDSVFFASQPFDQASNTYSLKLPISPAMLPGTGEVYSPYFPDVYPVNFQCGTVGIAEYNKDTRREQPMYFDLMGNLVDPVANTLLIEQVGNLRRKIVISE